MSDNTGIEWTEATWNPVKGCSIVSAGCTNCYAMQMAARLESMGVDSYAGLTRKSGGRSVWTGKVFCDYDALNKPLSWKKGRMIFVNSMSDVFHEDVPDDFIKAIWSVMARTPQHTYQILTKRHTDIDLIWDRCGLGCLPNVWMGVSVEEMAQAHRIHKLGHIPAVVRFVSFEPLIADPQCRKWLILDHIDWVIVGGESASKERARPMKAEWVDDILSECREHDIAFFFKQWGSYGADGIHRDKKHNGNLFRGKEYKEMPTPKWGRMDD